MSADNPRLHATTRTCTIVRTQHDKHDEYYRNSWRRSVIYFYIRRADARNEPVTFLHRKKRATVTGCDVTPITKQKYRACVCVRAVRVGDYDSLLMRCTRIKPDRPDSSKFTKRRRVAGPRAAGCNLMETERNTAASQLAPLPFTFGRPLSCLRRDNCQRWTCFINADTPARTRLCERGTPTVTRIRLPCNTSSPRCGS